MAVHPHVCGEYPLLDTATDRPNGSSPRVWGIRLNYPFGFTFSTVHPHVCGEYPRLRRDLLRLRGSSPRVWGIHKGTCHRGYSPTVHPHVCGEYAKSRLWWLWGWRFIPTCVGNTPQEAHATSASIGSSPRVWGIRSDLRRRIKIMRFIPTCVGNTRVADNTSGPVTVHPHVCGEYIRFLPFDFIPGRFIPTCVGNTFHHRQPRPSVAVHPHVCGEYIPLSR